MPPAHIAHGSALAYSVAVASCSGPWRCEAMRSAFISACAVRSLLEDPERAKRMGEAAKTRVRDEFLGARSLLDYLTLTSRLLA